MTVIDNFKKFYSHLGLDDLPLLKEIYSDDVVLVDPVGTHCGLSQVTEYFTHLLSNNDQCKFVIHTIGKVESTSAELYSVTWTMSFATSALKRGQTIHVDGMSQLNVLDNKIVHHQDYYDLGQMVYEHIPLLGSLVKKIKNRLRK
jgi:hypothetical protein